VRSLYVYKNKKLKNNEYYSDDHQQKQNKINTTTIHYRKNKEKLLLGPQSYCLRSKK